MSLSNFQGVGQGKFVLVYFMFSGCLARRCAKITGWLVEETFPKAHLRCWRFSLQFTSSLLSKWPEFQVAGCGVRISPMS